MTERFSAGQWQAYITTAISDAQFVERLDEAPPELRDLIRDHAVTCAALRVLDGKNTGERRARLADVYSAIRADVRTVVEIAWEGRKNREKSDA